jgi:hypothetical protein
MSGEDFRAFVFDNPVRMLTSLNPDFFRGTAVEAEVKSFLASEAGTAAATRPAAHA